MSRRFHDDEMPLQTEFQYSPLDKDRAQIRLLKVIGGDDDDPISCEISRYALDDGPVYTALSYTWDTSQDSNAYILLNGIRKSVGKNLWDFLHRYRFSYKTNHDAVLLWVDAVCIDQRNITERNHQVPLMRRIYTEARQVISWLGEATSNERLAFQITVDSDRLDDVEVQNAVVHLFEKRYWARVWIIQEYILPPMVLIWCGAYSAHAESFDQPWPTRLRTRLNQSALRILSYRNIWHRRFTRYGSLEVFGLYNLIQSFNDSQTSERYDKVYGFLGLASAATSIAATISPDYSKPPVELLMDVLRHEKNTGATSPELLADMNQLRRFLRVTSRELLSLLRDSGEPWGCHAYAVLCFGRYTAPLQPLMVVTELRELSNPLDRNRLTKTRREDVSDDKGKIQSWRHQRPTSLTVQQRILDQRDKTWSWNFRTQADPTIERDKRHILESSILLLDQLMQATSHRPEPKHLNIGESLFLRSLHQDPWRKLVHAAPGNVHQQDTVYTRFGCSNGLKGILVSDSQLLLRSPDGTPLEIWTFGGVHISPGRGILVRRESDGPSRIRGLAVLDSTDSLPALPSTNHDMQWVELGLLELLELQRICLLNPEQVHAMCIRWLDEDDTQQFDHQRGVEGLSTFGPIWT